MAVTALLAACVWSLCLSLIAPGGGVLPCAAAPVTPTLSALPTSLESAGGTLAATLTVAPFRVTGTPVEFTTRAFNGAVPGPTLVLSPGDHLRIDLNNTLTATVQGAAVMNSFHYPNVTNVHTHGLHVSPSGTADNIFRVAHPGETLRCTFWYHAHVHGSTALQVGGGLAGVGIVRDDPATAPAELLAMPDFPLLVSHWVFGDAGVQDPYLDMVYLAQLSASTLDMDVQAGTGGSSTGNFHAVNGQYQPTLALAPQQWVRLRVVNGGTTGYLQLVVPGCSTALLANDGIYIDAPATGRDIILAPGSRRDVALRCDTAGNYSLECTTAGLGEGGGGGGGGGGEDALADACTGVLAHVFVSGDAVPTSLPATLPPRTDYIGTDLRTVSAADIAGTYDFRMTDTANDAVVVAAVVVASVAVVLLCVHAALVLCGGYDAARLPLLQGPAGCCTRRPPHRVRPRSFRGTGTDADGQGPDAGGVGGQHGREGQVEMTATGAAAPPAKEAPAGVVQHTGRRGACRRQGVNWPCAVVALVFVGVSAAVLAWTVANTDTITGSWGINDEAFTGSIVHHMRLGTVEEWTVTGMAGGFAHPAHVHVYPMQLQSTGDGAAEALGFRVGEWYDTIPSLNGGSVVRLPIATFDGHIVLHCHILPHEDLGMMALGNTTAA